jgi:hypothetical protein
MKLAPALYALVGIVNLLPVVGVASAQRLERLYGVALADPNLVVLMRHRALLFGVVGGLLVAAAWRPALRPAALAAGLFSMLSFASLAALAGDPNAALTRVMQVDLVASALLIAAAWVGRRASPAGKG